MIHVTSTLRTALTGIALAMAATSGAQAATVDVTVDNTIYTIGLSERGPFTSLLPQIADEPWWGDASLATQLSAALGDDLGTPNDSSVGEQPWFAYATDSSPQGPTLSLGVNGSDITLAGNRLATFAIAESVAPIPVPPAAALLLGGLGALGLAARRRG